MKFRERLARFMQGRYGADEFSRFLSIAPLILMIASLALTNAAKGIPASILWAAAIVMMGYGIYRSFSKNIYARQAENAKYRKIAGGVKGFFKRLWQRIKDTGKYKHFRCPSCKTELRVPCRKGKVKITCRNCGEQFMGRT